MHRFDVPLIKLSLLWSWHWGEMSNVARIGMVLFCLLVPACVILLYRYEMRLVRPMIATGLLALRLVVVLFLLCILFLQPVLARTKTEELQGRVLVAIDRSNSSKVADPQRPPLEKLQLAKALQLGNAKPEQLDAWIEQYKKNGAPEWVGKDEFPQDTERRKTVAAERRRLHDETCQLVDRLTRAGVAYRVLHGKEGAGLISDIAVKHKVEVIAFSQEPWDVEPDQLMGLLVPYSEAVEKETGKAQERDQNWTKDDITDIRKPLIRAQERSGKAEGRILGVVLLTDGQHNNKDLDGKSPVDEAIKMGKAEKDIPIYPIALGTRKPPPDVAIVSVQAPPAVFKNVDVSVEARVKVSGISKREIVLELQQPGKEPLRETIQHDGTDRYYTQRFTLKLDQVGSQTLTVTAKPVEGEIRKENNSRPVVINVADDKAKVLLVDGEARWEYHYLSSALLRDKTMQVQSIVMNQPRLGKIPEEELEKIGNPRMTWPTDPDALASFDCIVLGDVAPSQLPLSERIRLEKYVGDRGGTLVILAGKRSMPMGYQMLASGGA